MKRQLKLSVLLTASLLVLTACGRGDVTSQSSGLWDQFVYFFGQMIGWLSFGGLTGLGIILFTILIRLVLLPLYNTQIKSSQKMQALQPELSRLQARYPGRDMDSRMQLSEATQALYAEHGVNPFASLWPLFIQMPILIGLFQALTRVPELRTGHFLWFDISQPDPYFILPLLAAGFTFLSSWLTTKAVKEKTGVMTSMTYIMPAMIFLFAVATASGVALYWTVSNAFQVAQILLFNNPFKILQAQEAERLAEKERQAKIRRAKKKAQKRQ